MESVQHELAYLYEVKDRESVQIEFPFTDRQLDLLDRALYFVTRAAESADQDLRVVMEVTNNVIRMRVTTRASSEASLASHHA